MHLYLAKRQKLKALLRRKKPKYLFTLCPRRREPVKINRNGIKRHLKRMNERKQSSRTSEQAGSASSEDEEAVDYRNLVKKRPEGDQSVLPMRTKAKVDVSLEEEEQAITSNADNETLTKRPVQKTYSLSTQKEEESEKTIC